MADGTEGQNTGAEASGAVVDPAAVALALSGASRERADAFLKKQEALIDDQRRLAAEQLHHLREQLKELRLNIWEKYLGMLLRIATAFVGIVVAGALAWLIWNAASSNALMIDSFSVPPDLAAKGLTGDVLAEELINRITKMSNSNSLRAPQSYASNLGDNITLQIPETGVSLSELDRFLRQKLGHDTHISGAVIHTGTGLKLTARSGDLGSDSVVGADSDIDILLQRLAEAIYGRTQPYRFGVYLSSLARFDQARTIFSQLARSDSVQEQSWANVGLGVERVEVSGDDNEGFPFYQRAAELDPRNALARSNEASTEQILGRWEGALFQSRKVPELLSARDHGEVRSDRVDAEMLDITALTSSLMGDFQAAAREFSDPKSFGKSGGPGQTGTLARYQALGHDLSSARMTMASPLQVSPGRAVQGVAGNALGRVEIEVAVGDWDAVTREADRARGLLSQIPDYRSSIYLLMIEPDVAVADARLGHISDAETIVRDMPGDCYPCLIARAKIAEIQGQHQRADFWFAKAESEGPSLPFASYEFGNALLKRDKPDAAIEKYRIANKKGPHFADPLESWGEALMAKNRSDLALAKFEDADKYAPNWGRLHLKWGEALYYAGSKVKAAKEFTKAATLVLTASEKTELAGINHG